MERAARFKRIFTANKTRGKFGERPHAARHNRVENRPKVRERVLNGRPRECQHKIRLKRLRRFRKKCCGRLDALRFVKDDEPPLDAQEKFDLVAHRLIGCNCPSVAFDLGLALGNRTREEFLGALAR